MNGIKKIKQRLFRGYFRVRAHIHVRHWRGHGIHSPFMYGIVRNVFMKDRITGCDTTLYDALRSKRVGHRHAVIIQNLYTHCRLDSFTLIPNVGPPKPASGRNLCILLPDVTLETIAATAHRVSEDKGCMIILSPHRSARHWHFAQQIWQHYPCVSVDRRVMTIYFFNPKLPPQHYRI